MNLPSSYTMDYDYFPTPPTQSYDFYAETLRDAAPLVGDEVYNANPLVR